MSSLVYCPNCNEVATEAAYGRETGEYICSNCGTEFRRFFTDAGRLASEVLA